MQDRDRILANRRRHAVDPADLGDELGGAGDVMGDTLDGHAGDATHHLRGPGVAIGPRGLRQRCVRDLSHDVAAEPPPVAVDLEKAGILQCVHVLHRKRLVEHPSEVLQGRQGRPGAEHRGVLDDRTLGDRKAIEARRDQGAKRARERTVPRFR